ncbi:ArsR/SmtB family transcription factor [Sulfobacillus harzensis]|uniref:Winged helix-turn-helix transcriptional regulator n=1 Tax=Sulfobacillus harzensis TaxID=2729629 RepID=A0A7Y0L827_9FIRM|nr:metalloregulator ArsR/SmtB family transcription factor [Sulfobacillus harzensis]NMP23634.1 winged helix-turn-helix transcriptional regulator [Sulfobacillus harzensis]
MELQELAQGLKALSDPTRLKIVALLRVRALCVCELVPLFNISQPAISRHMRRLRDAGLVQETRRGQWVFYSLNTEQLTTLANAIGHLPDFRQELQQLPGEPLMCTPAGDTHL